MKLSVPVLLFSIAVALLITLGVPYLITKWVTNNQESQKNVPTTISLTYKNIDTKMLKSYLDSDRDIFLLDVHIPEQEHIVGTDEFIPFNELASYKPRLPKDKNTEIVVYCRSGSMSQTASQELIDMGYTNVKNLSGGINAWKAAGYQL